MKQEIFSKADIQNIRNLLWSNVPENDLLALEIIRTNGLPKSLEPDFIMVALTAMNDEIREKYQQYLHKQNLGKKYGKDISTIEFRYFSNEVCETLKQITDISQLLYAYFQRTGSGFQEFLIHDDGTSPYRPSVFEHYLTGLSKGIGNLYSYRSNLRIAGLTEGELSILLEKDFIQKTTRQYIWLAECKITELPDALFSLSGMETLIIEKIPLTTFPKELLQLTNLRKIRIYGASFDLFPKDWSALKRLEELELPGSSVKIDDFSFVSTLPKLKKLSLGDSILTNPYLLMTPKALPLTILAGVEKIFKMPLKKFLSFASALRRSALSETDRRFFFDLVRPLQDFKTLPELSLRNTLKALTIPHTALKEVMLKRLNHLTERQGGIQSFGKASTLCIIGTTNLKKTDIKAKLKALEIGYETAYTEKVTHLLVGKNPKGWTSIEDLNLPLITENQLQKFFTENQPQYLEQAAQSGQEGLQENLSALLSSPESTNVMLALEMLKSGGVPPEILEELLVVQKTNPDSKVRSTAKKLLELYAPEEWLPLIRDKQHFVMIGKKVREQDINNKLHKVAQKSSRALAAMLSIGLFKMHRRGLRYIFYHFKKPHAWRTKAFQAIMEGTHCDYSAGLGFTNLRDRKPENVQLYKMKIAAPFPVDILEVIDKVESIDFHNCKLDKLHQDIRKFTDLKALHCSCNRINKLPKVISKLENLEVLDLSNNNFKEFPMGVLALKKLKKLDLRYMQDFQNMSFYKFEIPEEAKVQLIDCEVLI